MRASDEWRYVREHRPMAIVHGDDHRPRRQWRPAVAQSVHDGAQRHDRVPVIR
jgi:hypothetical protein